MLSVEHDVTDTARQKKYIQVFSEVFAARGTSPTKASDYSRLTEISEYNSDNVDGYRVKMTTSKLKGMDGKNHKASVEFWIRKNLKSYDVDGTTYDEKSTATESKSKKTTTSKKKTTTKKKKTTTKKKKTTTKKTTNANKDIWTSSVKTVTDNDRIATYETIFQEELKDKVSGLKFPLSYHDYEMSEKRMIYNKKKGYFVSVDSSKLTVKGDTNYHEGRAVFWIDKDGLDDMSGIKMSILEFDGTYYIDDKVESDDSGGEATTDYEKQAEEMAKKIKAEAISAGFSSDALDVTGDAHMTKGKEDAAAVDVMLMQDTDDKTQAKTDGEKLKKIVLKYVKYGSVTVQKYKVNYQWNNY